MSIYKLRTEMGHYFKWLLLFVLVPIFVIGGMNYFGSGGAGGPRESAEAKGIIAKVNGEEISRRDFETAWERAAEEAKSRGLRSALAYADLRARLFQQMVNDITLLQAAKQMGIDISQDRVNAEIEKVVTMELNANREAVLGKLDRKGAAVDPRNDDEYKRELATINSSLALQIDIARSKYPESQVQARLAQQGLLARIKAGVKPVTDADITASYNIYKIRQIALPGGGLPQEQLMSKARKIAGEAASGADFAKLARENTPGPGGAKAGAAIDYTFESSFGYPEPVKGAIEKLKPGQVSPAIETPYGIYIVKLESVTPKIPAKLDKKGRDARRDQIRQMREFAAGSELQREIMKSQKVQVLDAEMQGYWSLFQAQRAPNPVEMKKQVKMAISALMRARQEHPNNYIAIAKLAQLLYEDGKTEESVRLLYPMLEGDTATQEGADLRMLLGDMLIKKGEKDRAIAQYKIASEVAMVDPNIHQQLIMKFQQLKRPDLVAAENKWMADYNKRLEDMKAMQRNLPARTPLGGGAPPGPTPPGPRE